MESHVASTDAPTFGLVAGELSGDNLGAGLISALKKQYPNARFIGIGGPRMQQQGLQSLYEMSRLSLMGISEVLPKLAGLLAMRRELATRLLGEKVDVFIGIDAPDFNIGLERKLKARGVKTVHYVSPSIWAWRQGRVHKIAKSVDLMLTLLPFEAEFYQQNNVPVKFVGHRLASEFPLEYVDAPYKERFRIKATEQVVALLPGSRNGEVKHHLQVLLDSAEGLHKQKSGLRFLIPAANDKLYALISEQLQSAHVLADIEVINGESRAVISAADVVVLASGTVAFETMLMKKPMVVIYKAGWLSYNLIAPMVRIPWVSLPNLLADEEMVPELIQDDATAAAIIDKVMQLLEHPGERARLKSRFLEIHKSIRQDSDREAASAIMELLDQQD